MTGMKTHEPYRPVGKIRVKTCHIDRMLLRQVRTSRLRLRFQIGRVLTKSLQLAGGIRAQEGQVGGTDADAFGLQRVKRLRLVHHVLQCHRVGNKFVVNDGFFLIRRRR